jgi:hypothetical protein
LFMFDYLEKNKEWISTSNSLFYWIYFY